MIDIKELRKNFGRLEVLKSISLSIERGKLTYIIGPNKSGKTTLIKNTSRIIRSKIFLLS